MKPKQPAAFDFRTTITAEIDLVLTAKARALCIDKAAVARDILARWASEELAFCACLESERLETSARELRLKNQRKPITRRQQNTVFSRDGFKCRACGSEPGADHLHIDHIVPISAGGPHEVSNMQVLCAPCNLTKGNKIVSLADSGVGRHGLTEAGAGAQLTKVGRR